MKQLIVLLGLLLSVSAFSQKFDGISIGGDFNTTYNLFLKKGYSATEPAIENGVGMKGYINGMRVEVYLIYTPKSKKVHTCLVYLPKRNSWTDLSIDFDKYVEIITEKYGEAKDIYKTFRDPYYLGDGYELQAITLEKASYFAYWNDGQASVAVQITKYQQLLVQYENNANMAIKKAEEKSIISNSF